ncbi:MAG TPA: glycoside hydrolase family 3 N-terminal domain-containing protein [Acidimicrobiales bacterium]|nr:glycoside hydrolase family 3 N-terminal domain-containing protein [Acidimicrobiales bacterium]
MLLAAVLAGGACSPTRPPARTTTTTLAATTTGATTTAPTTTSTTTAPPTTAGAGCAQRVEAGLSEAQRIGQLFMLGEPLVLPDAATRQALHDLPVGGVVLFGRSRSPATAIRALTDRLRALAGGAPAAAAGVGLFVATDQEGGQIQNLAGPGFDAIPSAVVQGMTDPAALKDDARRWATQLGLAGVNIDLAPVLDVVPPAFAATNQPIAHFQRQLGDNPATVASHGAAVVGGFQAAGVGATVKHFPGLGRVVGNTDDTASVADTTTTRHDPSLAAFAAGIHAGARFALVSSATYTQIDPTHRAVFSSVVMRDMLRGDLGFQGLVLSDDLGAAAQVGDVAPGTRAVDFLAAGGTVVLAVRPVSVVAPMMAAVQAEAAASAAFRQLVDADALAVLAAKQAAGLLFCP